MANQTDRLEQIEREFGAEAWESGYGLEAEDVAWLIAEVKRLRDRYELGAPISMNSHIRSTPPRRTTDD